MWSPFLVTLSYVIGLAVFLLGIVVAIIERVNKEPVSCFALVIIFSALAYLLFVFLAFSPLLQVK